MINVFKRAATNPNYYLQENISVDPQGKETEKNCVSSPHSFKEIYARLAGKLSKSLAKNLSVSIAFVCILHLANEKVNVFIDQLKFEAFFSRME